jgi:hypothetical protein
MSAIHTAYAMIKMPVPKGVITLKSDQCDALACENAALMHVGRFGDKEAHELAAKMAKTHAGEKEAQELAAKMAKTHGGSTPVKMMMSKPPTSDTPLPPAEKKGTFVGSMSDQLATDQPTDDKKKGATDKDVQVDPNDIGKKLCLSAEQTPNRNSRLSLFSGKIWMSLHGRYHICPGSLGR